MARSLARRPGEHATCKPWSIRCAKRGSRVNHVVLGALEAIEYPCSTEPRRAKLVLETAANRVAERQPFIEEGTRPRHCRGHRPRPRRRHHRTGEVGR